MISATKIRTCMKPCFLLLGFSVLLAANAAALNEPAFNEQVIYNFTNGGAGINPNTGLISDTAGNLYGGTQYSDSSLGVGDGTIFELIWNGSSYTYVVLYTFTGKADGTGVIGTLVRDAQGNLYGTGDASVGNSGNVFELSPNGSGGWTLTVLYTFTGGNDGAFPNGGVVLDKAGNLYGAANEGGRLAGCYGSGCGVVFELSPGSNGIWTETVLHAFSGPDGAFPNGVVSDPKGNLYGTTSVGGTGTACGGIGLGCGIVFRLSPSAGHWTESVLHSFYLTNTDGTYPLAVTYINGNLFGVTLQGGTQNFGTVFEVALSKSGAKTSVIHSFAALAALPRSPLVFDQLGNLYGAASGGGNSTCGLGCGAIFELTRNGATWTETILHEFTGGTDGAQPYGSPILTAAGLIGTAPFGGTNGYGVVFELTQ